MLHTILQLKRKLHRLSKMATPVRVKSRRTVSIKVSNNQIILKAQNIHYTLRQNPRSKSIRLSIKADGDFTVTAPPRVSQKMIESIVIQKQDWVLDKIEHFKKFNLTNKTSIPRKTKAEQRAEYLGLKDKAQKIATEKVLYWNTFYNFKFNKISIKNQKTRWGSCSKKGNLNFSYKIALLPDKLADYLVVHEIAHLGQFNHSAKFWALVAETIPDYKNIRKELKGVK